jgi:hypothetical protein
MSYRKQKRYNKRKIDKKKKEQKMEDKRTKKEIGQFDKLEKRKQLGKKWSNWIE